MRAFARILFIVAGATVARANNILLTVTPSPPADGLAYQPNEVVRIVVRLNDETTDVNSLILSQVDLELTNASLVSEFDPHDSINPINAPVIFGGEAPGDGIGDAAPGPALPGCPQSCLIGSVISLVGDGTIYFWLANGPGGATFLNPPGSADPGLLFIQFKVLLGGPPGSTAVIDLLGPAVDDGASSGAFSLQAQSGQRWANGDPTFDPNDEFNYVGGVLNLTTVPEPSALALLLLAPMMLMRRRGS